MINRANYAFELGMADLMQHAAKECLLVRGLCAPLRCFAIRLDHHAQDERRRLTRLMGNSSVEQASSIGSLQVDEVSAFGCLWETLRNTKQHISPSSGLHRICEWGILHLVTLEHGLVWHPNIDPSADHALQDALAKQEHPANAHSDMQALMELLPHIVAALETSEIDSTLNLCAEYLYDSLWEVHLHLAPQVSDSTFGIRAAVHLKDSTQLEGWKRLRDATDIALGQAGIGGRFVDFLQNARAYLRLIGYGLDSEDEYLPGNNGGEAL